MRGSEEVGGLRDCGRPLEGNEGPWVVTDTLVQSSRLHVRGSCQDESMAGMSEESGLAEMCWRRLVGFGNM
jgi:hypothetical protein